MKLGARILKTGIAITLALFLSHIFDLPSPVFAGIAAILPCSQLYTALINQSLNISRAI